MLKFKKVLFISALSVFVVCNGKAQMLDLMGGMAVEGVQSANSLRSVGLMKRTLNITQFLNHLQMKITDLTTSYFANYQNMPVQSMNYQDVKVVFRAVNNGQNYEAFISPLSYDLCQKIVSAGFDNLAYFRFVDNGVSSDYTVQQALSNAGLCISSDAVALILK
jgi:hypothetical protein